MLRNMKRFNTQLNQHSGSNGRKTRDRGRNQCPTGSTTSGHRHRGAQFLLKLCAGGGEGGNTESLSRNLVLKYMNKLINMTSGTQSLHRPSPWQNMSGKMVPIARKLLENPATSTLSERSFNVAGRLIEERRTSL